MPLTDSIRALEKAAEKQALIFFTWLGAGAAPESWQQDIEDESAENNGDNTDSNKH